MKKVVDMKPFGMRTWFSTMPALRMYRRGKFAPPVDTVRINVMGNAQVLEACRKARVERYILHLPCVCLWKIGRLLSLQQAGL